jgi:hypothetical protein
MKIKKFYLNKICYSIDLALLALRSYDIYSYNIFIKELKENDNKLFLSLIKIRFLSKIEINKQNFNSKIIRKSYKYIEIVNLDDIKKIILTLSKLLNSDYSNQNLDLIYFYFVSENALFIMNSTIIDINKFSFLFLLWIKEYERSFSLNFYKNYSRYYNIRVYPIILYFSLRKAIFFLNFYKNL